MNLVIFCRLCIEGSENIVSVFFPLKCQYLQRNVKTFAVFFKVDCYKVCFVSASVLQGDSYVVVWVFLVCVSTTFARSHILQVQRLLEKTKLLFQFMWFLKQFIAVYLFGFFWKLA